MRAVTETAYAKLNLALHVRGRLADRRHRIETIFAFCEDGDRLSVEDDATLDLTIDGPPDLDIAPGDNLVMRAAYALRGASGVRSGARMHLTKRLPIASGLGGGSADAAAALRALIVLWEVDPCHAGDVAPKLGADVPACLISRFARGTGAGDELELLSSRNLEGTPVLLINPRVRLGTAEVFERWDQVDRGPLGEWDKGRNDLEGPAISIVPQIGSVLAWLSAQPGVTFVRMSGSGATCFALFEDRLPRDRAAEAVPREWWHMSTQLR